MSHEDQPSDDGDILSPVEPTRSCVPYVGRPARDEPFHPRREANGRFARGGTGRRKGQRNRSTVLFKEALMAVYRDLQAGHEGEGEHSHFFDWAIKHPSEFYRLAARLLPLEVDFGPEAPAIGVVVFKGVND